MNWKRLARSGFSALLALALFLVLLQLIDRGSSHSAAVAAQTSATDTVRLHGQIRDTDGNPRQAYVSVSTHLGPDIAQGVSAEDGSYEFDVPALDHYVVTAFPLQRAAVGGSQVPIGFLDRWERVNRTGESDMRLDIVVRPGGTILLDAYDPHGRRLFGADFPHQAMFAAFPLGSPPVSDPLHVLNHQRPLLWGWETVSGTLRNPAVLILPSQVTTTFTVWGLWTVPEAGTIMLEMDNGELGFSAAAGEAKSVNIVYEIARTEYRKARQKFELKISAGYVFSPSVSLWLAEARAALDTAQIRLAGGDGPGAAVSAYQALTPAIRAKEEIVLQAARQDIESRRDPVSITVLGPDGLPVGSVQVDYRQINHDFVLGCNWGGDAVPLGDTPETRQMVGNSNIYAGIVRDIGFEYVNYPPYPAWGVVQREWPLVPYRFDDDVILHKTAALGFRSTGNAIWMVSSPLYYPAFLESMDYAQVKAAALSYVSTTLSHYAGKIQLWNLMNEPNGMNGLDFAPAQMLDFTGAVLAAGKAADPGAEMSVLLTAPGLAEFGGGPGYESALNLSTYDYLNQMLDAGVRPDVVGIQFYNGAYLPAIDLGTVSDLLDVYGRDFDLPFYIEELEYPTHEEYPGLVNLSSFWGWHQGHTDQAQADWAVGMFTLAFSKPHIMGANWSLSYDLNADRVENGREGDGYLHRDGLTVRPMAHALADLFRSWKVSGSVRTDEAGQADFSGLAGEYLLTLTGANGAVRQEPIHVREGQTNTLTLVFDPGQTLVENRLSAAADLDRVGAALTWAGNLGKTSGVAEAKDLYSQARSAFSAGQYWDASLLSQQACDALAIRIDGEAGDWAGVRPLYSRSDESGEAGGRQLRRFYGTLDASALVMQFEFDTSVPRRNFLFELDAGADGVLDYAVGAAPMGSGTLFFPEQYSTDPALVFTHLIPSIDVIYGSTVEMRIPLADLGNPTRVQVALYRETLDDGTFSELIPSLGVVTAPPWRTCLPLVEKR